MMGQFTMTIQELVENDVNIFKFDYPIFDESYRKVLEQNIIDHYYFCEIGESPPAKFIHRLKSKMNLIMPYYNKVYESDLLEQRILDNYDVKETYERTIDNVQEQSTKLDSNGKNTNTNLTLSSDTPQTRVDIESNDFVSDIRKDNGGATIENTSLGEVMGTDKSIETWVRTMQGNIGVQTDADAIAKYRSVLLKIDLQIIEELNDLFMGVY